MHQLACPRYPVRKLMAYDVNGNLNPGGNNLLPLKYVQSLEQNQLLSSCCRHPEAHEIEAWFSCEEERQKGTPDIYKNYCTCGRVHVRFCVGGGDVRPFWDVR